MRLSAIERSPQRYARLAGVMYLAIILLGMFGELYVRGTLIVPGDAGATARAIAAAPQLWRAGIVGDLLMHVLDVPVIVIFYVLLRPVDKGLALLATLLNFVQTAVLVANKLNLVAPLFLLGQAGYLQAFSSEQLQVLSLMAIDLHVHGFAIGLIFFGLACVVRGVLIWRCGFWPKAVGAWIFFAGVSYLCNSFALLLAPSLAAAIFPGVLVPAFVGELAFCLWLIFKGVNPERWRPGT